MVWFPLVASKVRSEEMVPVVGNAVVDWYTRVPAPEMVPSSVRVVPVWVRVFPEGMESVPTAQSVLETVSEVEAVAVAVEEAVKL
jgi:hypothetical protein